MSDPGRQSESEIPEFLDGALVLCTAPALAGVVGTDYATGEQVPISYFAIAAYSGQNPGVYLFGVSSAHDVVSDWYQDSVEDAMRVAHNSKFTQEHFSPRP